MRVVKVLPDIASVALVALDVVVEDVVAFYTSDGSWITSAEEVPVLKLYRPHLGLHVRFLVHNTY